MATMDELFDGSDAHLLNAETLLIGENQVRIRFEAWISTHAPEADFTRGVRDEYIVLGMQGEWEAFVQGFVCSLD